MGSSEICARLQAIRSLLAEQKLDALFCTGEANVKYLSAFTNCESYLLVFSSACGAGNIFLTDSRYLEQAERECREFTVLQYGGGASLFTEVARLCQAQGVQRLGFEPAETSFSHYEALLAACLSKIELAPAPLLVEQLRAVKDAAEISLLREACAKTDRVFDALLGYLRPGLSERQVEWQLRTLVYEQGCSDSFRPIVVSGPRGSLPHGEATDALLEQGEFLTMDFGCCYRGYHADMTRTVHLGAQPDALHRKVYAIVKEANQRGEAAICAGAHCADVDAAARSYITEQGYGAYFGHGLGHGVGLAIHERPMLNPRCKDTLAAGNFVTVEPGIYLPGQLGLRIEDTLLVTETGGESLFRTTKDLICL